jgi:succinoglycan biosynthesis protein ExoM
VTPVVCLTVCTADRPTMLDALLARLAEAPAPALAPGAELRVLVVDNRPEDGRTRKVAKRRGPTLGVPFRLVKEPVPGIVRARNRAVAAALADGADLVAFIDDDDRPRRDWLAALLAEREASGAELVLGTWEQDPDLRVSAALREVRFFQPPRRSPSRLHDGLPIWGGTYNMLASRRLLEALKGREGVFRERFSRTGGEDSDLIIRAARLGFRPAVAADSVVYRRWHGERATLRGACRRGFRAGVIKGRVAVAHLAADTVEQQRGKAARAALDKLRALPRAARRRAELSALLVDLAKDAGEVAGYLGIGYRYYA